MGYEYHLTKMANIMKICKKCQIQKSLDDFYFHKINKDQRQTECKVCSYNRHKLWVEKAKADNPQKANEDYKKRWATPEAKLNLKETALRYREKNRERLRERQARFRKNNPEYAYNYLKKRMEDDPIFKMRIRAGALVSSSFKKRGIPKRTSGSGLIGCTNMFLEGWFTSWFTPEMTLENYGSYWHIDHEIPCSAWDLTNDNHVKACFHWTNLRPLEKNENLRKSGANVVGSNYSPHIAERLTVLRCMDVI